MVVRLRSHGAHQHFRLLAEGQQAEGALHHVIDVTPVADIQLFATNANGRDGVEQLSDTVFRWLRNREVADLAGPVAQSHPREGIRFQHLERNGRVDVIFST
jgi:hypothetical protein